MNYTTDFLSIKDRVSPQEWQARVELAACYRLVDVYGMTDLIYNHITARVPGEEDVVLLNLYGLLYKEITASSLVKIHVDGGILWKPETDYDINKSGYMIHGAIHKARPDVACVLHTHTRAGMAVSAMKCGLLPLSQTSIRFVGHIGYHEYEGPAVELDERERLVRDLGPNEALIMRNHGLLTCGATVQQAFNTMYQLELSCRSQVDAMAARTELTMPGENVLAHTAHMYQPGTRRPYGVLECRLCCQARRRARRTRHIRPYWALKKFCNPGGVMLTLLSRLMMAASLLFALAPNASADDYPNRPVRLIIPFPPGGSNDVVGRLVAQQLSVKLGQQVYVDNRGGAGGTIGTEACANATPDGYTICIISIAHAVNPGLYKLKYDPIKSFTPISIFATGPNVLVVNPTSPIRSVKDLIALAKEKPGSLNYASAGVGSFQHLGAELFKLQAGVNIVHVPYKGGGPAMQDVIAGHVKIMFSSLVQTTPFIKSGQLIALGTGGAKRSPVLPDAPTIAEAGVPGYVADNWWGLAAPAGLPQPLSDKLYAASQEALKSPELQAAFDREGAATVEMTPEQFAEYIKTEIAKWGRVVKEGNIHAQ
jgi:tripartite-type tricarboxylate transporter receptor subunit TctC/ribulose-5-phosphate 4-epimerase/fuculose-1-phosphate aldolase